MVRLWNRRKRVYQGMQAVNEALFACLLSTDYPTHRYAYERRLHVAKRALSQAVLVAGEGEAMEAALLEVTQLRFRVSDWAEFELCRSELTGLQLASTACFTALRQNSGVSDALSWLESSLLAFEGITEHVLKVSARDPTVYLLFLNAWDALRVSLLAGSDGGLA